MCSIILFLLYLLSSELTFFLNLPYKWKSVLETTLQVVLLLISIVGVHHNSHPLLFAPLELYPVAVLSRLSSLHVFTWAEFFHSCYPFPRLTIPFTHAFWQSSLFSLLCLSFSLPSSSLTHQSVHYACSAPCFPPPLTSSCFSADLSLQIFAVLEKPHQAHLCFLVPDTIITRRCWAAGAHKQLLSKHCGNIRFNKICNGQKLFLSCWAVSSSLFSWFCISPGASDRWDLTSEAIITCPFLSLPFRHYGQKEHRL